MLLRLPPAGAVPPVPTHPRCLQRLHGLPEHILWMPASQHTQSWERQHCELCATDQSLSAGLRAEREAPIGVSP